MVACVLHGFCCTSTITIAATTPANDTVCAGGTIKYTAIIVANGGTGPTYQWKVNGLSSPGATAATYTFAPSAGDVVTCVLNNSCGTATSNSLSPFVKPVLNQMPAVFFCNGYTTTPIALYGATWTNSNTTIGLATSGTGDIPSFTTVNNSNKPVTATITAIQTCAITDTAVFPIIINPVCSVNKVANQTVCAGDTTLPIKITGPIANTGFSWASSNPNIGLAASGTGDSVLSFKTINNGATPIIDTITVTPLTSGKAFMNDAINPVSTYGISRATHKVTGEAFSPYGFTFFGGYIGITVTADGKRVYTPHNRTGNVCVVDGEADTLITTIPVGAEPWGIVASPDGKHVYVANSGEGSVSVINTATNTVSTTIRFGGNGQGSPEGIAISPDGSRLYVADTIHNGGRIYFIDTRTNKPVDSVNVGPFPCGIVVSPDGSMVYTAHSASHTVTAIKVSNKAIATTVPFSNSTDTDPMHGLAISPDGLTLYASSYRDGPVSYFNTATSPPTLAGTINLPGGGGEAPVGLSMSVDGKQLYVSNTGNGYYPSNFSSLDVINTATKTVQGYVIENNYGEEVSFSFGNFLSNDVPCTGTPSTFTITVNPSGGTPVVSLTSTNGKDTICAGVLDTFIATATGMVSPNYNFKVNGVSVQNGASNIYITDTLHNKDSITCVVTGNVCGGNVSVTTNKIKMTVNAVPPIVTNVTASPPTYHPGDNIVITATDANAPAGTKYRFVEAFPESGGTFKEMQNTTSKTLNLNNLSAYGGSSKSPGVTWLFVYANNECGQSTGFFYQISVIPPANGHNPSSCSSTDGSITFPALLSNTQYKVTYSKDNVPQGPFTLNSDNANILTIPNLGPGTYTNIILQVLNLGTSSNSAPADSVILVCNGLNSYNVTYNNGTSTAGVVVHVCPGISNIGLANADTGVTYTLRENGFAVETFIPTTAGAFNFSRVPKTGGTYIVTATKGTANSNMGGAVILYGAPKAVISATGFTGCAKPGVKLSASGSTATSGSISSYQWLSSNGSISSATDSTYVATATGNYRVVIITSNSCTDTSLAKAVTANQNPTAIISGNFTGCETPGVVLKATTSSAGSGTISVYRWRNNNGSIIATDSTYSTNTADNYSLIVINSNNCSDTSLQSSVTINPNPTPPSLTTTDTIICSGDSAKVCMPIDFKAYHWNTGDTTICTFAKKSQAYWVTVTDDNGCSASSPHQTVATYLATSVSIGQRGDTLVTADAKGYQWYRNGDAINNANSRLYGTTQPGIYRVEIIDSNGCRATSSAVTITGMDEIADEFISLYPNPNSVGTWHLEVSNELVGNKFEVYNIHGQIIFQSDIRNQKSEILLDVPSGLYWLKVFTSSKTIVRKMLKI